MDAMQKKRMRRMAIVHFGLSVFCFCVPIFISTAVIWSGAHDASYYRALEHQAWKQAWLHFNFNCSLALQPQFWFFSKIFVGSKNNLLFLLLLTIPVWSICFGWIFAKLDNWLNHFPVLGKRVF